jgi:ubiquinone/menaquinone biosynthesis C-methylase UbiE
MKDRQRREKGIWDKLAKNYDKQVKVYDQAYKSSISKSLQFVNNNSHVLDMACGTGIISLGLAKYVKQLTAIDLSAKMIKVAEQKAKKTKHY